MIDSHTHLVLCDGDEAEVVAAASAAGVGRMLTVGMDAETNPAAIAAAERHQGVFAAVGRHPNEAGGFDDSTVAEIIRQGGHEKVRAIGETGLDYYRDGAPRADQRRAFAAQIEIAIELGLPIVIHARDPEDGSEAVDEIFATLDARAAAHPVVLHCFSAPARVGDAAERGWHCSFAGNVTYPSAKELRFAAAKVPDELLLVETDAPYLSPQPLRGKRNQPANVVETAKALAAERGVSYEQLERTVEANAAALFGW
jgi:TatD DNase family protein